MRWWGYSMKSCVWEDWPLTNNLPLMPMDCSFTGVLWSHSHPNIGLVSRIITAISSLAFSFLVHVYWWALALSVSNKTCSWQLIKVIDKYVLLDNSQQNLPSMCWHLKTDWLDGNYPEIRFMHQLFVNRAHLDDFQQSRRIIIALRANFYFSINIISYDLSCHSPAFHQVVNLYLV